MSKQAISSERTVLPPPPVDPPSSTTDLSWTVQTPLPRFSRPSLTPGLRYRLGVQAPIANPEDFMGRLDVYLDRPTIFTTSIRTPSWFPTRMSRLQLPIVGTPNLSVGRGLSNTQVTGGAVFFLGPPDAVAGFLYLGAGVRISDQGEVSPVLDIHGGLQFRIRRGMNGFLSWNPLHDVSSLGLGLVFQL